MSSWTYLVVAISVMVSVFAYKSLRGLGRSPHHAITTALQVGVLLFIVSAPAVTALTSFRDAVAVTVAALILWALGTAISVAYPSPRP